MQFIKYCMLFCVFLSSTLIGKYISQKYKFRLEELEEMKNALNIFKSKIKFTYEPIPEIFDEISKNTYQTISKLFKNAKEKMERENASVAYEKSVDEIEGNLKKEDKQTLKTLSKLLRNHRCRRANWTNWSNRRITRQTNKRSKRRERKKRKTI